MVTPKLFIYKVNDSESQIAGICIDCKKPQSIVVRTFDYVNWNFRGQLTQNAFPYLNANEREFLESGICGKCFDKTFKDSEQ